MANINGDSGRNMLSEVFLRLDDANLTVTLRESDFAKAYVNNLGYKVGAGQIQPVEAKVKDIVRIPCPASRIASSF